MAFPRGGHDLPDVHNAGDTNSIFTSWTTDKSVAEHFATKDSGSGVVLSKNIPAAQRVSSPDFSNEGEVLVIGEVVRATVEAVAK